MGHSLGEIAALHWGGALDSGTALRLAETRGRAMADVGGGNGAMASLGGDAGAVAAMLGEDGDGDGEAVIAAFNSPRRTVISGDAAAVEAVLERARDRGLAATRLRVSHAFHSPAMAAAGPRLAAALETMVLRPLARPVASTITGGRLAPQADLRGLLQAQLTSPVRFAEAVEAVADQADLWIEVGPGRALSDLAGEILERPVIPLDVGGPSLTGLLQAAGAAFVLGVPLQTAFLFEGRFTRPFDPDRPLRFLANPCEAAPVSPLRAEGNVGAPLRGRPASQGGHIGPPLQEISAEASVGEQEKGTLDLLRQLVAQRAELPPEAVSEDSRLLSDLHLNSISVGQLVVEASRRLGLRPPAAPTEYARATVGEVAQALEEQVALGETRSADAGAPAGVDTWVRAFTVELVPRPLLRGGHGAISSERNWRVIAPPGLRLAGELAARLAGSGVALCLPPEPDERQAGLFVQAARTALAAPRPLRFALIQQGGTGGGFARTLHLERPGTTTCVVDLPLDHPEAAAWVANEVAAASGYVEAHYDEQGLRRAPVLRLLPSSAETGPLPLSADDVLLVTGGGKGIAAECALDLARATGARLALLGRSRPEGDAELAANLERMAAAGVRTVYVSADVADAAAVRGAAARVEEELGPVTALLHGAGVNRPRPLSNLDEEGFLRTLAPKAAGFRNVLAAIDTGRLRLLVTFGSIIARTGLPGEADYAVANEWLARSTERFAREHPGCRCLALEWSVWAGTGMGERLGTLESLRAQGITPIPPETGVTFLRELISRELPATSLVVTGRFGEPPTLEVERSDLPLLRYLEKPRFHVPGVELVVDADVSADTDPHLADHVFRGEPLFAAVLGLEAMAQASMALAETVEIPVFENVVFQRPVAVPAGGSTTLRIAALVREPGVVEVALRDASTGFAADHFRAVCRFGAGRDAADTDIAPRLLASFHRDGGAAKVSLDAAVDLYGGLLFHRGRFRRVQGYRRLHATECLAEIAPDGATAWFGRYLPDRLVLGDPGARDAAIHGIQACIPHATLLPVAVDRLVSRGIAADTPLLLAARERNRDGNEFVYDLEVLTADGVLCERWEGLRLRAVDRIAPPESWTAALLAPYVERRLQEILPGSRVQVALEQAGDGAALRQLRQLRQLRHRPDGKPEAADGSRISRSRAGGLVLAVAGNGRLGCDLERVTGRAAEVWLGLLGPERFRLAELIARERSEGLDAAATRVWVAMESLIKAGVPAEAPLVLESAGKGPDGHDGHDEGWLLLRSGELRVGTFLAAVRELDGPAALAVLVESVH